jgi:hypothetical protein
MVVVRIAESSAVAVLLASVAASVLLGLSLWRGRAVGVNIEILMAAGLICGLAWGIFRRPRIFAAALETDRQLNLSELLSTAWLAQRTPFQDAHSWAALIVSQAEARCSALSRSSVVLRRLGGRMWGATALALGLVIALRILAPAPQAPLEKAGPDAHAVAFGSPGAMGQAQAGVFLPPDNRPVILDDPQDLNHSSFGENPATPPTKPGGDKSADHAHANSHHDGNSSTDAGAGAGAARTDSHGPSANPTVARSQTDSPSAIPGKTVANSSGTGVSSNQTKPGNTSAAGTTSAAASPTAPPAPWTGGDWPADIRRANAALNSGQVPAGYRDLVRGYFAE